VSSGTTAAQVAEAELDAATPPRSSAPVAGMDGMTSGGFDFMNQ
jgi:hypothetical protein